MEALPTQVVVEVQGVGYEVLVPLSSYDRLPAPGVEVLLLTHLAIREDAHLLYGFLTSAERDLFRLLINTVSGIGRGQESVEEVRIFADGQKIGRASCRERVCHNV